MFYNLAAAVMHAGEFLPWLFFQMGNDPDFRVAIMERERQALGAYHYLGVRRGGVIQSGAQIRALEHILDGLRVKNGWTGEGTLRVVVFLGQHSRNAAVAPWGTIYVGQELLRLCYSDAEVAAILAHELAHFQSVSSRFHPIQLLEFLVHLYPGNTSDCSGTLQYVETLVRSITEYRSQELVLEADRAAIDLLLKAGYPVNALEVVLKKAYTSSERERRFWKRMREHKSRTSGSPLRRRLLAGYSFASHPDKDDRITAASRYASEVRKKLPRV